MFQRILVPLDNASRVTATLHIASDIAHRTGAQLVLVRSEPSSAPAQRVIGARAALQRHVNALRQQGVQAEYVVEVGWPEEGIAVAARDRQVDLILLVPEQRERLELLWYPRRATRELNELPAPLLVWPESHPSGEMLDSLEASVMVPLDGVAASERSLPFAIMLAERYRRPLVLVQAIPMHNGESCRDSVRGIGCFSDQVQDAEAYLHNVRERIQRMTTTPIRTAVVAGDPGTRLLRAAKTYGAGVIVLCSHSRPVQERYFMGCVATQLLRESDVPILVVPPHLDVVRPAMDGVAAAAASRLATDVTV